MAVALKARIVRIGNSRGVRIPSAVLDQLDLGPEIEMTVKANQLVIRPLRHARRSWDASFGAIAKHGDDRLLDETNPTQWEKMEWEW